MKPWQTDTQNLAPNFTIFVNRTRINVRLWNNFNSKELKIAFVPSLTNTNTEYLFFPLQLQLVFFNQSTWITLLQRVAYVKNIFIVFYTDAIILRLMCNFSIKPFSRIVQKRRKHGKNVEMNHWLISGVGIWKLVESLLRREDNCLSCLYVIKKRKHCGGTAVCRALTGWIGTKRNTNQAISSKARYRLQN